MMVGELIVGWMTGSLALTADGWHMGTHVGALGLTLVAYWYARTRAGNDAFSFGTGKVYALAGYTSGVVLAIVALLDRRRGIERLVERPAIDYVDALPVAVLGLVVNLVVGVRARAAASTTGTARATTIAHDHGARRTRTATTRGRKRHARPQPARGLHPHPRRRADLGARDRRAARSAKWPAVVPRSGDRASSAAS